MSETRIYTVPNPLEVALSGDGPTAGSLLADADARVARLADDIALLVADRVALLATWADQPDDALLAGRQSIAGPASAVLEVAEAAGMCAVGSIARGVCVLLEDAADGPAWPAEALRVHLRPGLRAGAGPRAGDRLPQGRGGARHAAGLARLQGMSARRAGASRLRANEQGAARVGRPSRLSRASDLSRDGSSGR
ncbi:hypothetical protein [Brevundimonas sp.]|uniref:hypothetical protein n=1 Tax=Brevundimonas sp. TaxID=1871086 RepID=UPI0035B16AD2